MNHGPGPEGDLGPDGDGDGALGPDGGDGSGSGSGSAGGGTGLDALRAELGLGASGPSGDSGSRDSSGSPGSSDLSGSSDGGLGTDELALRRMMRQAVEEIEPSERSLEHLRKAVPARRARKRQAVVGLAAAALFIGTAVPALVHVTNSSGDSNDRPSIAGNSQESQGGSSQGKGPDGGEKDAGAKPDKSKDKDKKDKKEKRDGKEKDGTGGGGTGSPDPSASEAATTPVCDAAQLGATGTTNAAEADGKVYGTFRVSNISDSGCTIEAAGSVGAAAQGAADPAKIAVVDHAPGDAAAGLPDPSQETTPLVLQPGAAYEVRFAWVPGDSCPTEGGDPSPNPTPSEGAGGTDGGTPEGGVEPQLEREDGGVAEGSVVVSLTAAAGAPSAGATITNACAGTVYRTGVLPAS
ncbi:hypothetical protein [Streptomyces sp. NPDC052114]|uniref:hypothetical protein n=1 Tax=unclassified Streptomyces TaxID=2593676 RepID=UPI00342DE0C3